jgi:hypothetical protein
MFNNYRKILAALFALLLAVVAVIASSPLTVFAASKPVMGERTQQVERDEVLTGLPTNDIEDLPPYLGELKLAEASFEVAGKDEYGLPNHYTAHLVYRGSETTSFVAYYETEAVYHGVSRENPAVPAAVSEVPDEAEPPIPIGSLAPEGPDEAVGEAVVPKEPGTEVVIANIPDEPSPVAAFWDSRSGPEKIGLLAGAAVAFAVILAVLLLIRNNRPVRAGAR